ncbi:hypothetical protein GPALN_003113 [Globodera pallida]|nr:hypothetical protein GPALN_003113 [Globodera pallida]
MVPISSRTVPTVDQRAKFAGKCMSGPSCGLGAVAALLSLAVGRAPRPKALTGIVLASGHVTEVGAVKEKIEEAQAHGMSAVVTPQDHHDAELANDVDFVDVNIDTEPLTSRFDHSFIFKTETHAWTHLMRHFVSPVPKAFGSVNWLMPRFLEGCELSVGAFERSRLRNIFVHAQNCRRACEGEKECIGHEAEQNDRIHQGKLCKEHIADNEQHNFNFHSNGGITLAPVSTLGNDCALILISDQLALAKTVQEKRERLARPKTKMEKKWPRKNEQKQLQHNMAKWPNSNPCPRRSGVPEEVRAGAGRHDTAAGDGGGTKSSASGR